ncbi:MAG: ribonuclease H-like domain-containing protein, partial [Candidatus Methanomethylophilaceae archaeon]|nr:ribonuclease H-like domain-containing protein [Candidatus Methanomethylophilaceae archaeon]
AETLQEALDGSKMLVTFNGKCFDVPVLRYSFPNVDLDIPHFDLRYGCGRIGLKGGLKPIERMLGITRADEIHDVDGEEAVRLWMNWEKRGDSESLRILTEYNRADTINLETISGMVYDRLVREYAGFKDL